MRSAIIEIVGIAIAASVVVGASASATTYRVEPTAMLTGDGAETIVTGRVRSTTAEWHGRRILTRVVLDVEAGSAAPPSIEFLVPGGSVGGVAMRVSGAPKFEVGERTQVTLRATTGGLRLVGLGTGKVVLP